MRGKRGWTRGRKGVVVAVDVAAVGIVVVVVIVVVILWCFLFMYIVCPQIFNYRQSFVCILCGDCFVCTCLCTFVIV